MTTTIKGSIHGILDDIVPKTNRVEMIPYKIIVAWSGVLTLAFNAWPKPLMDIKQRTNDLPEFRDKLENFGTKWPKITLASLNDDVPPLTLDQLRNLTAICQEFDSELQQIDHITLTNCSVVLFSSRSLEHVLCRVDYAFKTSQDLQSNEQQAYDEESYKIVQNVVEETQHLEEYLHKVNAPGHRWKMHYNSAHTESTLVCFLNTDDKATCRLLDLLESFRMRVDKLLPDYYHWMSKDSLHLSLRALENRSNLPRDD